MNYELRIMNCLLCCLDILVNLVVEVALLVLALDLLVAVECLVHLSESGEDLTGLVTLESDLAIMLDPGAHTVTGPAGLSGSCRWRNRFI